MTMAQILPSFFSAAALVLVAIIETRSSRSARQTDERAARRAEESRLSMELMFATCRLATVTAKAVFKKETNGDVEAAFESAVSAQDSYEDWKTRTAAKEVAKL